MKNAILVLMTMLVSTSAFASARLVTLEEQIIGKACRTSADQEIQSLCKQLTVRDERRIKAIDVERRLYPIYEAELAKNQSIINYGGLNDIRITCDAQADTAFKCQVSARAGDDGGVFLIDLQVLVVVNANGELNRALLSKSEQGVD